MADQENASLFEIRRASISPAAELDEATAARLLRVINTRHSRGPLSLDQVYLFPGTPSNQAIDHYGTRMAESSLRNYLKNVRAGVALMNSHRTGGLFAGSAELPIGRLFEGELSGEILQVGKAGFGDQVGQELAAWHYMIRGVRLTDVSNDDLIASIDGGTIRDESIGFSLGPDGQFTCSICGRDYLNRGVRWDDEEHRCPHLAFVEYDGQRAFVWVERAKLAEVSLVYKGATPGAMIRKAMACAPQLDRQALGMLEEHYQVRLLGGSTHPVKTVEDRPKPGEAGNRSQPEEVNSMSELNRAPIIELLEDHLPAERVAQIRAVEDDDGFALAAALALVELHQSEQARVAELSAQTRALQQQAETLATEAEIGRTYRDDLVTAAVAARVRVQGNAFDAERYRGVLVRSNDLDFIKSEKATWEARAAEVLRAGPGQTRQAGDSETPVRAPAGAYQ